MILTECFWEFQSEIALWEKCEHELLQQFTVSQGGCTHVILSMTYLALVSVSVL